MQPASSHITDPALVLGSPGEFFLIQIICCIICFSIAVIEYFDKSNFGGERDYFAL